MGLLGALILIFLGIKIQNNAPNIPLGNILFLVNASSYSIYLIMVKPLVKKIELENINEMVILNCFYY